MGQNVGGMRLRVIHWNVKEAAPLLDSLRAAGHDVALTSAANTGLLRTLRELPPHAVIIDLTRQPSHGREVAIAIRGGKTIKHLPILFLDGEPERVDEIRRMLPDALYTTRAKLATALKRAKPVANPARPPQMMERFGNRTAAQKLGIGRDMRVAVVDPPADYARAVGALPEGAAFEENPRQTLRLTLWFVHDPASFQERLPRISKLAAHTRLWILWRKGKKDGFDGGTLRRAAMDFGLVDYKICSVNETWSGMAFAVKKLSGSAK